MNEIDAKILGRAKLDYGENCELVRRTEWSYSFKCGPKSFCRVSRFCPIPYDAFLAIAGDLFRITRSEEYEQAVRKYFGHSNQQVRWWAQHSIDVPGPTNLKRNEE